MGFSLDLSGRAGHPANLHRDCGQPPRGLRL